MMYMKPLYRRQRELYFDKTRIFLRRLSRYLPGDENRTTRPKIQLASRKTRPKKTRPRFRRQFAPLCNFKYYTLCTIKWSRQIIKKHTRIWQLQSRILCWDKLVRAFILGWAVNQGRFLDNEFYSRPDAATSPSTAMYVVLAYCATEASSKTKAHIMTSTTITVHSIYIGSYISDLQIL